MLAVMAKKKEPTQSAEPAVKKTHVLHMRLPPELDAAMDRVVADQTFATDRTAIGIRALEELFTRMGYWPPPPPKK